MQYDEAGSPCRIHHGILVIPGQKTVYVYFAGGSSLKTYFDTVSTVAEERHCAFEYEPHLYRIGRTSSLYPIGKTGALDRRCIRRQGYSRQGPSVTGDNGPFRAFGGMGGVIMLGFDDCYPVAYVKGISSLRFRCIHTVHFGADVVLGCVPFGIAVVYLIYHMIPFPVGHAVIVV